MPHNRTTPITCKYSKSEQLYLILLCKPARKMQHTITTSADGSSTLQLTEFGESYHSTNGAFTEAMHIYIKAGVEHLFQKLPPPACINIFDVGFGTALNCILLYAWQQQLRQAGLPYPKISYYGIEKYPIQPSEAQQLNYPSIIAQQLDLPPDNLSEIFHLMHNCPWEEDVSIPDTPIQWHKNTPFHAQDNDSTNHGHKITPFHAQNKTFDNSWKDFILHKSCADIAALKGEYYREACWMTGNASVISGTTEGVATGATKDSEITSSPAVVFYDTFSPATQPHLWDEEIFRNIAAGCPAGSVLVTYCSKGTVKQALRGAGFTLERLAGPPGKRHILRGTL